MIKNKPISSQAQFDPNDIIANTKVFIEDSTQGLSVKAYTPRLFIRPIAAEDVPFYQDKLWGDKEVITKFADGKVRLYKDEASEKVNQINYAQNRIVDAEDSWCNRWAQKNPYSGMTVLDNAGNHIGHVIIGGGELAYLFAKESWGQGYGSEAVTALTSVILPNLVKKGYTEGLPDTIEATTRVDHIASQKVLERAGLSSDKKINYRTFGGTQFERYIYQASVNDLVKRHDDIVKAQTNTPKPAILTAYQLKQQDGSGMDNKTAKASPKKRVTP